MKFSARRLVTAPLPLLFIPLLCCEGNESESNQVADGGDNADAGVDGDTDADRTELVGPIDRGDGTYVLEIKRGADALSFSCMSEGGLVTAFSLNGTNILTDESVASTWGSTFWTSPQSDWSWPPPSPIDSDPYEVAIDENTSTIILTSGTDTNLNVQVTKRFSPDLERFAINLEYTIKNTGSQPRSFAPWEVTRLHPLGLTFFELGAGGIFETDKKEIPTDTIDGIVWFTHSEENTPNGDYKLYADGAGWSAHARDNWIFVKSFPDQPATGHAPGQGEIEIYTKGVIYEELEQQGVYQEIPAGGETTWRVTWYLTHVPEGAAVAPGNAALAQFAKSLL